MIYNIRRPVIIDGPETLKNYILELKIAHIRMPLTNRLLDMEAGVSLINQGYTRDEIDTLYAAGGYDKEDIGKLPSMIRAAEARLAEYQALPIPHPVDTPQFVVTEDYYRSRLVLTFLLFCAWKVKPIMKNLRLKFDTVTEYWYDTLSDRTREKIQKVIDQILKLEGESNEQIP